MTCRMCGQELAVRAGSEAARDPYRRCPCCRGLLLDPYPVVQDNCLFESPAAVADHAALEAARGAYFLRRLVRVEKRMDTSVQDWRLLEIGCGSGVLLRIARDRGWRADGLEMSPELAARASERNPEAEIFLGDICSARDGKAAYDAVLALDVIEHVLAPEAMLRTCWSHLRPGGLLLLQTPNVDSLRHRVQGARWDMRDPTQHVNLFSAMGLRELLDRTRFTIVDLRTVSGSGLESGTARAVAAVKEWVLSRFRLGNALTIVARRR